MKHEIGISQPDFLVEDWPGKYSVFSWLEYVITVPNPIFLVTTLKENGKANANLHSWGFPLGDRNHYSVLLSIMDSTHTFQNILRTGEFCVNYPSYEHYPACFETIAKNGMDNDEICDAGLTLEAAKTVSAPRIAECFFNLECRLEWNRPIREGSRWQVLLGLVLHVAVNEAVMVAEPGERARRMGLMYNMRGNVHPLTGDFYGPNTLGLLNEIVKITPETEENVGTNPAP
jgi:flavin reductase (DIM6/NTAB) family NADH-FMN oxidoreductase RutF